MLQLPRQPSLPPSLSAMKQWCEASANLFILPVGGSPSTPLGPQTAEALGTGLESLIASIFQAANSVAKVKLGASVFTGFMIDDRHLVTVAHPFRNHTGPLDVEVVFSQWDNEGHPLPDVRCEVDWSRGWGRDDFANHAQDWAILSLRPLEGALPRGLDAAPQNLVVGNRVILIDYPNGGPVSVSSVPANLLAIEPRPSSTMEAGGEVRHGQTVSGGSSGAPILDLSMKVVALQRSLGPYASGARTEVAYNRAGRIDLVLGHSPAPMTQISPGDIHILQSGDTDPSAGAQPTYTHGRMFTYVADERWFTFTTDDNSTTPKAKEFIPIDPGTAESKRFVRLWFQTSSADYIASENSRAAQDTFRGKIAAHNYLPFQCDRYVTGTGWKTASGDHYKVLQGGYANNQPSSMKHVGYVVWSGTKQHWLLFDHDDPGGTYTTFQWIGSTNYVAKGTLKFVVVEGGIPSTLPSHEYVLCTLRDPDNWPTT